MGSRTRNWASDDSLSGEKEEVTGLSHPARPRLQSGVWAASASRDVSTWRTSCAQALAVSASGKISAWPVATACMIGQSRSGPDEQQPQM